MVICISIYFDESSEIASILLSALLSNKAIIVTDDVAYQMASCISALIDEKTPLMIQMGRQKDDVDKIVGIINESDSHVVYLPGLLDDYDEIAFSIICRQCPRKVIIILGWRLEIMPMCYTMIIAGVFLPIHKICTYDVSENIKRVHADRGYISCDRKLRYMGCNDFALGIFTEMADYTLDKEIPCDNSLFYNKVFPVIKQYAQGKQTQSKLITVGEQTYEIKISSIETTKHRKQGYMLEISDVTERQKYISMIENYNKNLESEVAGKTHKIREIRDKTVLGMAQMVESRDLSTGGHIKRTSSVVSVFSKELLKADLGFEQDFLYYVEKSAPMHDLGKIAVDDQILRKQGKFTDEEYEKMKAHSAAGAKIVRNILSGIEDEQFVTIAVNVAHYHHEKVDGSGYPEGLKGEEIPVEARIMALADVFDALVSKRCYKEAFSFDKAFSIIEESAGHHFDAGLADVFLRCRPKLEALYRSFGD